MPPPALEDVIAYLLNYQQSYGLQHAARRAEVERQGKTLITWVSHKLPGDGDDPYATGSGVAIKDAVTDEVLWVGSHEDWPQNEDWVLTDGVADLTFEEVDEPEFAGVPQSLLETLDVWCQGHAEEARDLVARNSRA